VARKKQLRFAALEKMDNVVDGRRCDADWFERAFGFEESVVLELGCGHGEYTLAFARSRPDCGVLGVDRNGARLWKGAEQALDEGLTNAFFLRAPIEHLEDHIPPGRVGEVWLPFPDPLPKNRQARHRLPSPLFLERYRRLLYPGGTVHLKTDDMDLVDFAEQAVRAVGGRVLEGFDSLTGNDEEVVAVETTFEKRYRGKGRTIYDRTFRLD
jgi:tRNA (guanine-N7-)-methyltransferase